MSVEFRKATSRELSPIMEIIDDAKAFMKASGLNQWQDGYPNREIIGNDIEAGKTYVLVMDGLIAATAFVSFDGEPDYIEIDGAWPNDEPYMVIHKVAAAKAARGKGATVKLFEYIEELSRKKGVRNLRIDTHRDNLRMQGFLKKMGFFFCGNVEVTTFGDDKMRMGYQKIL